MQDICGLHVCIQQTNNPSDINCAGETRPAAKTKTIEQRLILNSCKVLNSASYWVVGCGVKPRRILPKCNMLYFCRWVYTLHHSFIPGRLTEYTGLSILLSFSSSLCRQELLSGLCCWIFIVSPKTSKRQLLDFSFVTLNRGKKKKSLIQFGLWGEDITQKRLMENPQTKGRGNCCCSNTYNGLRDLSNLSLIMGETGALSCMCMCRFSHRNDKTKDAAPANTSFLRSGLI